MIFQESRSRQSELVEALTGSRWTHMGIVFVDEGKPVVLEAVGPVKYTPFSEWVARGHEGRYVVKRLRDADQRLGPQAIRKLRAVGESLLGRPYDFQFRWGDEALYCSELVHKLMNRAANVSVGRIERARDMNFEDGRVRAERAARFSPGEFNPDEPVVTPVSIFEDRQLVEVR